MVDIDLIEKFEKFDTRIREPNERTISQALSMNVKTFHCISGKVVYVSAPVPSQKHDGTDGQRVYIVIKDRDAEAKVTLRNEFSQLVGLH